MLRITNSKCKTAQFVDETYQGNPMGIDAQCKGCGIGYDQAQGQLAPCEHCQAESINDVYCKNCHNPHTREHFNKMNQPNPMMAPY